MKREATVQGTSWGLMQADLIEADVGTLAVYFRNIDNMIHNRR